MDNIEFEKTIDNLIDAKELRELLKAEAKKTVRQYDVDVSGEKPGTFALAKTVVAVAIKAAAWQYEPLSPEYRKIYSGLRAGRNLK